MEEGGARKFCPRGWRERESPPPAQRLSAGAPLPGRRTSSARSSPPPPTAAVSSGGELRRLLPGAADPGWKLRPEGRGRGCRVLAAVGSWPPPRSGWCLEARKGLSLPLPWGPPYELRPLPARLPGAKARGFSATRCPGPILLKSPLPRRAGGWEGVAAERSFSPPQRRPFRWRRLGLHGRREPPRPLLPGRTRAEERSARTQTPAAPRPGRRPGRRGWRRSRWLQGARAAPRPGSHPFPLALARNVGL